jgi:hypothetical protein
LAVVLATFWSPALLFAQQNTSAANQRYAELVNKAADLLESGKDSDRVQARSYIDQARNLNTRPHPAVAARCDFYDAWLLCQQANTRTKGEKLFRLLLANYVLEPQLADVARHELDLCTKSVLRPAVAKTRTEKSDIWVHCELRKGVTWSEPLYLERTMPLTTLEDVQSAHSIFDDLKVDLSEPFIVAGTPDRSYLASIANSVLKPYYNHLVRQMGAEVIPPVLYAFVARDSHDFTRITQKMYRVTGSGHMLLDLGIAFSDSDNKTMVAQCGSDPANCTSFAHELFHVLNSEIYPDAPWWLSEGMAELYESGDLVGGDFRPGVGWRKRDLHRNTLTKTEVRKLLELWKNDEQAFRPPYGPVNMARAQFFCQYLNSTGKLWVVYHSMRERPLANVLEDPAGIGTIEQILGRPFDAITTDFLRWLDKAVVPVEPRTDRP